MGGKHSLNKQIIRRQKSLQIIFLGRCQSNMMGGLKRRTSGRERKDKEIKVIRKTTQPARNNKTNTTIQKCKQKALTETKTTTQKTNTPPCTTDPNFLQLSW